MMARRRRAQARTVKYGKKPLKGEEVRWGLENLAIDEAAIKKLGFDGLHDAGQHELRQPRRRGAGAASTPGTARSGWCSRACYDADNSILKPMIRASAEKYAAEKKVAKRDCAKEAG